MLASCTGEGKTTEPSIQCNFEGVESPDIPVTVTEQQQKNIDEDDLLKFQRQNLEDVAKINEDDVVNTFDEDTNQEEAKCVVEQEQNPTDVHEERREIPVLDKLRVDNT